jgi:LPS-assembly protein
LHRQDSLLQASYGPITASVGYTFTNFDSLTGIIANEQEALGSVGLKLTNNWSLGGMLRYNLVDNSRVQDQFTLKYADECFVLSAVYTETFVANPLLGLKPDSTIMLRFELKYLGMFNYSTDVTSFVYGDTRGNIPN